MNGAAITVETLIAHGVTDVFGYPGGTVLNLYDELYGNSDRITHRLSCHEQGAAHAADAYARVTGRVGVVIATSGPGATNLVTGIATAYLDSTPMIAITGNVPTTLMGKDAFQEVDTTGITMPITKHNFLVKDVDQLEETLCEAFRIARSGRPGPVLVDIPKDVQVNEADFRGGQPLPDIPTPTANQQCLEEAAALINASERPYIYAGGGVVISGAEDLLRQFAESLDAPVGLSMMGLTAFDSEHPLYLGMTGMHGLPESSKMHAEADLIIGIGVRFSDRATGDTKRYRANTKILHIDIDDVEVDKNVASTASVLGDLKEILSSLIGMLDQRERPEWKGRAKKVRDEWGRAVMDYKAQDEHSFTPRRIIKTVRAHATDEMVVVTDVGQHQMWVAQHYGFKVPRTLATSGGLGTMGFGMGGAVGACVAKGGARTLLFTGDGSFHMNMAEFATAVRYGLPIIVIVIDNSVLGMVRQWQTLFFGERYSQTTLERPTDYVKLAEALGGSGYMVSDLAGLEKALNGAFASDIPTIIDCKIDSDEMVFPMIPAGGSFEDMIVERN
ncbi:MAG: biosynthetic-type acetolactate synthase large subunit [Coriobacteriales bacterium]|nr:biosynthetic-type acetolactate synthase large subunit [Coriobacteriales bacterium]